MVIALARARLQNKSLSLSGTETESEAKVNCAALMSLLWEGKGQENKQVTGTPFSSVAQNPAELKSMCVGGERGPTDVAHLSFVKTQDDSSFCLPGNPDRAKLPKATLAGRTF